MEEEWKEMAKFGDEENVEETEYESGSEESDFGVAMRRRKASDDDDDYCDVEEEEGDRIERSNLRFVVCYGDESDGLGGYDEDEEASFADQLGEEEVLVFEEEEEEEVNGFEKSECEERECSKQVTEEVKAKLGKGVKQRKPPVSPRNGAFYMHDDRFLGRGSGHRRRNIDERFRESKHDQRWKHDKFDEIKLQETHDKKFNAFAEVRRNSEQYRQGYRKNQGLGRGYVKHQNHSSKIFRGRGPIKYKPNTGGSMNRPTRNNQFKKPQDETSGTDSATVLSTKSEQYSKPLRMTSSAEPARTFSRKKSGKFVEVTSNTGSLAFEKHALPANKNSTLQIFNSSGSMNHHNSVLQKDVQLGRTFGYFPTSALPQQKIIAAQCTSLLHGNIAANPIERDKLYDEKDIYPASEPYLTNLPLQSSSSWLTYMTASARLTGLSDLSLSTVPTHQLSPTSTQVSGLYPRAQHPFVQQMPIEGTIQPSLRVSTQQLSPRLGRGICQASEEPFFPSIYESGILEPLPKLSESKVAFGRKGISTLQGTERGSILSAETECDQDFTATASLFPALEPGSQHNGDFRNLAVNMALSGSISSSQNGFGNPEITWLPLFPAAGGPVGAAYLSYVAADGGYNPHSTGRLPSRRVTRYSRMNMNQQTE